MSNNEYKTLDRFPGYKFGSDGSVWTRWRFAQKGQRYLCSDWRKMKNCNDTKGYIRARILTPDGAERVMVHRLILEAFVGPCPEGMQCCHRDGDPKNNRIENLRYGTPKSNSDDRVAHGTLAEGESNGKSKLTNEDVRKIRSEYVRGSAEFGAKPLGRKYGVHGTTILLVVRGKTWRNRARSSLLPRPSETGPGVLESGLSRS